MKMACFVGFLALALSGTAVAQEKLTLYTVSKDGKPVLSLQLPGKVIVTATKEKTTFQNSSMFLHIWLVDGVADVAAGVAKMSDVIKGEVLKFKPGDAKDLTVAGAPAKQLFGPGVEADDGDDGHADVVVFTTGGRVFVACVHGEKLDADERQSMMAALQTVRLP